MPDVRWQGAVDFIVLAAAVYTVLHWSREARALRVTLGILMLEVGALVARQLNLVITVWILHAGALVAAVLLIVVFQPELRHALNQLEIGRRRATRGAFPVRAVHASVTAVFSLARARRGALLVLTRRDSVAELVTGGVPLGGEVSAEIVETIFRKASPVHDGAAIIEHDRITRVGAVLPLADQGHALPREFGTRHRAAVGLAQRSDALVLVASEERGSVTLVHDGSFDIVGSSDELRGLLTSLSAVRVAIRRPFPWMQPAELALVGLALLLAGSIWSTTLWLPGSVVRTVVAPIEFSNLAEDLIIADQSAVSAQVHLRGAPWLLDSVNTARLVLRADLADLGAGAHAVDLSSAQLVLPLGVHVEGVAPHRVTVRLQHAKSGSGTHGSAR